jgi:putative FmdB family regulatory protein
LPLYAYSCTKCGYEFERIQHFDSEPEKVCPKCKGELVRPLTAPAFKFKGTGWYVTDYAGKNPAPTKVESPAPACAGGSAACASCPAAAAAPHTSD